MKFNQLCRVVTIITFLPLYGNAQSRSMIKVETLLPQPIVKDASVDYTFYIQEALTHYDIVYLPPFPVKVNCGGLTLKDNQSLYFPDGAVINLGACVAGNYAILRLQNINNVKIYNANIVGDRYSHTGKGGEWGMGISILGSRNVTISKPHIINCWGDGIYIGQTSKNTCSSNIVIMSAYCGKNRRNGISVISAKQLVIKNSIFQNTDGTPPMAGIDLEPNNSACVLQDITLSNITTKDNRYGIAIVLGAMNLDQKGYTAINNRNVTINVSNHKDVGSKTSIFLHARKAPGIDKRIDKGEMSGKITFDYPTWQPKQALIEYENYSSFAPSIFITPNTKDLSKINALIPAQTERFFNVKSINGDASKTLIINKK